MTTPEVPQEPVYVVGPRGPKGDPGDGAGLSAEAVAAAIETALAALPPSGLTQSQVEAIVNSALSALPPSGLTSAAVQALIATALESVETTSQVNAAIAAAIAALPADSIHTPSQVNALIATALAPYENASAVTAAIAAALVGYETEADVTAQVRAALDARLVVAPSTEPPTGVPGGLWLITDEVPPNGLTRAELESVLYDKAYSWEKVPGSDVMATCVGVLPKIGPNSWAGLVTIAAGHVNPLVDDDTGFGWYRVPASTVLTEAALAAAITTSPGDAIPAGVYVAFWYGDAAPYAFPEGWTPGNTTGSGPVLPLINHVGRDITIAGLVSIDHAITEDEYSGNGALYGWYLTPASTPPTLDGWAATGVVAGDPAGVYNAMWGALADEAPTTFPPGWTFRPYGLGPIAITDENAGGLIGDIAYVVSGYVFNNSGDQDFVRALGYNDLGWFRGSATYNVEVGDVFRIGDPDNGPSPNLVTQAGTAVMVNDNYSGASTALTTGLSYDYWPFIERFDLANKKWLPRIPCPLVPGPPLVPAIVVNPTGPWVSGFYSRYDSFTYQGVTYYVVNEVGAGVAEPPSQNQVDSGLLSLVDPTRPEVPGPDVPYAAEGDIGGVIDGKLYFGGGDGRNITGSEFFVYDPADDSITRLADIPSYGGWPDGDYSWYGTVSGALVIIMRDSDTWLSVTYDVGTDVWTQATLNGGALGVGFDQVQGFEIDGKLWFVCRGKAYVFDPVAHTVTVKASGGPQGSPYLVGGEIQTFAKHRDPGIPDAIYDPATDVWTTRTNVAVRAGAGANTEFVGVTYGGTPYALSAVYDAADQLGVGVYGLTGAVLDKPQSQRLDNAAIASALVRAQTDAAAYIDSRIPPSLAKGMILLQGSYSGGQQQFPIVATQGQTVAHNGIIFVGDGGYLSVHDYTQGRVGDVRLVVIEIGNPENIGYFTSPQFFPTASGKDGDGSFVLNPNIAGTGMTYDTATNRILFSGASRLMSVHLECTPTV